MKSVGLPGLPLSLPLDVVDPEGWRQLQSQYQAETQRTALRDGIKKGLTTKGGPGSGNFDHAGRPGEVGGSAPAEASPMTAPRESEYFPQYVRGMDEHPISYIFHSLGKRISGPKYLRRDDEDVEGEFKHKVVTELAKAMGWENYKANAFIHSWANTANDHSMTSLEIQKAAAEVFDTQLSDWQKEKVEETQKDFETNVNRFVQNYQTILQAGREGKLADFERERYFDILKTAEHAGLKAGAITSLDVSTEDIKKVVLQMYREKKSTMDISLVNKEEAGRALAWMHQNTQAYIAHTTNLLTGPGAHLKPDDEVILFRGFTPDFEDQKSWKNIFPGEKVSYKGNALESWTFSPHEAKQFGILTVAARFKVKDIVGMPGLGFGCLLEDEVVVIDNRPRSEVSVVYNALATETEIKSLKAAKEPRPVIVINSEENDDWIRSAPGYHEREDRIYNRLKKRYETGSEVQKELAQALKGGAGSGNYGHAGRVGKIGGSQPQAGLAIPPLDSSMYSPEVANFLKIKSGAARYYIHRDPEKPPQRKADAELWRDSVNGRYTTGLFLVNKKGSQIKLGFWEDYRNLTGPIVVQTIWKMPMKGGTFGIKVMGALKDLADATGKKLQIQMVANHEYFQRFPWLKRTEWMGYEYDPKEGKLPTIKESLTAEVAQALKGGPGSGNFGHAGRPGKVGGSQSDSGLEAAGALVARPSMLIGAAQGKAHFKTAQEGLDNLLKITAPTAERMDAIDSEIKKLSKDKFFKDIKPPYSNINWTVYHQIKALKKERQKLARAQDEAIRQWVSSLGVDNPLKPDFELVDRKHVIERLKRMQAENNLMMSAAEMEKTAGNFIFMEPGAELWQIESDRRIVGEYKKVLDNFGSYINADTVDTRNIKLGKCPYWYGGGSAFYNDDEDAVYLPATDQEKYAAPTLYHELGHWFSDHSTVDAKNRTLAFYNRRTSGEKLKPLSKENANVFVKKDRFIDPYAGRLYENNETELISTGFARLFSDTYRFAKKDPEHFRLIVSFIRGIPEQ